MHRLIVIVLLFSSFSLRAQTELNSRIVEDSTYAQYLRKDWKQLLNLGHAAIQQDIDYYYLRFRMGIAAYELQKYQIALIHFQKAYLYNSFDDKLKEYIYFSLVFSSRYDEALHFSKSFSGTLLSITRTQKPAFINLVQLEGGAKYASSNVTLQPFSYINLSLNHRIGRGISFLHSATYLHQQGFYGSVKQYEYYGALAASFKRGFAITPAFHFIQSNFAPTNSETTTIKTPYYLGSLSVSKYFTYLKVELVNSISDFNNTYQIQNTAGITLFPLANQKLAFGAQFTIFTDDGYQSYLPMYQFSFRASPHQNFTFLAFYMNMQSRYFNEFNGYLVNNSFDVMRSKFILLPEFTIKYKFVIYAAFVHESKTVYNTTLNYTYNGISAGIKIKL